MDPRTRKLMTMHKAWYSRDDVDWLYAPIKEWGRGLASIEDSVNTLIRRFEDYIEKCGGIVITATRKNTDNTKTNRTTITRKNGKKNNTIDVLND